MAEERKKRSCGTEAKESSLKRPKAARCDSEGSSSDKSQEKAASRIASERKAQTGRDQVSFATVKDDAETNKKREAEAASDQAKAALNQDTEQKLLELAVEGLAGAQKEVERARASVERARASVERTRASVDFAEKQWRTAIDSKDEEQASKWKEEVKEAKEEVKEAEQKVKEAEQKVEKAEQKVKEAEQKVEKAKQQVKEAEQKVEKAKQQVKETVQKVEVTGKDFDIAACTRPPIMVKPNSFVQLAPCVDACIHAVNIHLPQRTEATSVRVPPTVLSRCMRGGKTTLLMHVFDKLKQESKNPIFISFNGDSLIKPLENESFLETMLRAIAVALLKQKPQDTDGAARVLCGKIVLKEYLKDKKDVVLIVDELNVLLKPSESPGYDEVGTFLREQFLDPSGRCLIFSTHIPGGVGLSHLLGKGSGSPRTATVIEMPRSYNMLELRHMDEKCQALTPCEAVYYGRIPSLIYSVKTQNSFNILTRFQAIDCEQPTEALTKSFLSEFFTGVRCPDSDPIRAFDSLTESPDSGQIRWILAYVGRMCAYLELQDIASWVEEIPKLSERVQSGQDWEAIVLVALSLRCVQAKYGVVHKLLHLPETEPVKRVFFHKVPQESCTTPQDIATWWKARTVSPDACPYIAVLSPNYAKAAICDAMWIYQQHSESKFVVRGLQSKLGKDVPASDMPDGMLGLLMRGNAPPEDGQPKYRQGWKYKGADAIRDFLGASLSALYPAAWPGAPRS